jgi:hypothetical protein
VQQPQDLADLLRAARLEVAAELRDEARGAVKASLVGGSRVGGGGDRFEYVYHYRRWPPEFTDKPLLIRPSQSRGPWTAAEVAGAPDGRRRVVTALDLGPVPEPVQVREDDAASWRVLEDRLNALGQTREQGAFAFNAKTAGYVLGRGGPQVQRARDVAQRVADWSSLRLNLRQREAIEKALASDVTFVWGPPGTGKTDVVSHIVEGCYRQGHTVLFLAPTNVAVDQAIERICALLAAEEGFDSGLVQRRGEISLASLAGSFGEHIDPARIVARLTANLDSQIADATTRLEGLRAAIALHDETERLQEAAAAARARQSMAQQRAAQAAATIAQADSQRAALLARLADVGEPTGLFAKRKGEQRAQLELQARVAEEAVRQGRREMDAAHRELGPASEQASGAEARLRDALSRLAGLGSRTELADLAGQWRKYAEALDRDRRGVGDMVRARCRVMGATVAKAVQSRSMMDRVDVVVIDEVGMVDLPSAWYAAGLAARRVVFAGDFRQLPAITKGAEDGRAAPADRAHCGLWAARDAFHAAGLIDESGLARYDHRLVALDTQYRMREAICGLVNAVAYPDAPLATGRAESTSVPESSLIEPPLVLIDTSSRRISRSSVEGSHLANEVHEATIHELVRGLQWEGVLPPRMADGVPPGRRPGDVMAVIAPYNKQVRNLESSLRYRFGTLYEGVVASVHRFQGSERDIVVIDTVAGAGKNAGTFYRGAGLSSTTCRLINVALSRARNHLVVVADMEFLRGQLAPHSEAAKMLDHLERYAHHLPIDQLIPIRAAADLAGLNDEERARPAFFPADEVHRAVAWDLVRAERSIEVYCAFLDPDPVTRWIRAVQPRIEAGVAVTVYTRDHIAEPRALAQTERLRQAGCEVVARERMHEKVLILDGTVLWHGSLNLLANAGPTDLMMRLTNPDACERVHRIMEVARMERPAWQRSARDAPSRDGYLSAAAPSSTQGTAHADGISAGTIHGGRWYLNVDFSEKDEAKAVLRNADIRWDARLKLWHVDAAKANAETLRRWLPDTH